MKLIQQAMEDHYSGLIENEGTHNDSEFQRALDSQENSQLIDDVVALDTGRRFERLLSKRVADGEEASDALHLRLG